MYIQYVMYTCIYIHICNRNILRGVPRLLQPETMAYVLQCTYTPRPSPEHFVLLRPTRTEVTLWGPLNLQ